MISLLFTKSNKIGSRIIRWGYGGETSHFAIGFDNKIVFHSHFGGPRIDWQSDFLRSNKVVYKLEVLAGLRLEDKVYMRISEKPRFIGYDYGALFYSALVQLFRKVFPSSKRPSKNLWSSSVRAVCLEMADYLEPLVGRIDNLDTMFPDELYFILSERLKDGHIPKS